MLAELAVDFPVLRARAHLSGLCPVDYAADAAVDYGPDGPVDYDAAHLWIGGLWEEMWGLASPPRPSGRTSPARVASCGCSFGAHGGEKRGWSDDAG